MRKFIIAPDSFKGTLTAQEVCHIMAQAVLKKVPQAQLVQVPMSDGGEGMVEAYIGLLGGQRRSVTVSGPRGEQVDCPYGILPDGTAVAEMAACAGLPLMEGRLDPLHASTYGVGELFMHLEREGCKKLLLGIGGSATCDCGVGMAAALGYVFFDEQGKPVLPYACNIGKIRSLSRPEKLPALEITVACDVDNPLCGPRGACAIFGPQKGLLSHMIQPLDEDIRDFAKLLEESFGIELLDIPGSGAAGGLGAALMAFCSAKLTPGIEMLLDAAGMDSALEGAELVITGEGRLDGQSISGKVPVGVSRRAMAKAVPCIAVCGCIGQGAEAVLSHGICAYYAASAPGRSMDDLRQSCHSDLAKAVAKALDAHL